MSAIIYKNLKYAGGFTLVEVIVVAVIVAVLATVAIPLYTNYIESSKKGVVNNCAGSLASFLSVGLSLGTIDTNNLKKEYNGNGSNNSIKSKPSSDNPNLKSQFFIPPGVICNVNWKDGIITCKNGDYISDTLNFKISNSE